MGVGVVMPGPFEIEGFSGVGPTTLPGWAGIDVAARAARRALGVPVAVENDANAAAIGETLLGRRAATCRSSASSISAPASAWA